MKVKILKVEDGIVTDAEIKNAKPLKVDLPSITDGWRFNFNRHAKNKGFETYILVREEAPDVIEGCLIFGMKGKVEPYMAFVETAPHNQGKNKEYDRIAGCLIAFACRLSFIRGDETYSGWLAFDVMEEDKEDEIRLMSLYSAKYNALRFGGGTTMVIPPAGSEKLINEFLN